MTNTTTQQSSKFVMFNEISRRFEDVEIDLVELVPGQSIVQMFWVESAKRYVTVPGASLYRIDRDLNLVLEN